jgi:transcriptional regulator with XRE-family HTH domain
MKNYLGDIIYNARQVEGLTQEQYGSRYSVSGPAIFKFEKGYVKPSLELWLKMAADASVTERRAVLLWIKSKLPEKYQDYIELQGAATAEREMQASSRGKAKQTDYSKANGREDLLRMRAKDKTLPEGLRQLLGDDELWALYKPTGAEINMLRDIFGPIGKGSVEQYREALRLVREFVLHKD